MTEIFRGTILQPQEEGFSQIDDGIVAIQEGTIVCLDDIARIKEAIRAGSGIDGLSLGEDGTVIFQGKPVMPTQNAILPPTNDLHVHTFQPPGIPGQLIERGTDGELVGWLPTTLREGEYAAKMDPEIAEAMARFRFQTAAASGIGRTLHYTTSSYEAAETVLRLAEKVGVEALVGYVAMDQGIDGIQKGLQTTGDEAVEATQKLLVHYGKKIVVIDRFPIAVSSETRRRLARLAREFGAGYETHADETIGEIDIHKGLYQNRSIIDVLIDDEVFEPGSVVGLAHALHTSEKDMDRVGDLIAKGAKVLIRACPSSNAILGSHWDNRGQYKEFPLREWEKRGAIISFGTDQGGGRNVSILRELLEERGRHPVNSRPSYERLLQYATVNGLKESFGVDPRLLLQKGQTANLIVVKMAGANAFFKGGEHYGDIEKTSARIIEGGQHTDHILANYVKGRRVK